SAVVCLFGVPDSALHPASTEAAADAQLIRVMNARLEIIGGWRRVTSLPLQSRACVCNRRDADRPAWLSADARILLQVTEASDTLRFDLGEGRLADRFLGENLIRMPELSLRVMRLAIPGTCVP